ncbi:MAG: hypothetical protein JXR20_09980 [Balneola sp.]
MLKPGMYKKKIMVDESAHSIADELLIAGDLKKLTKEEREFLLTDAAVMDKIVSKLMSDLKLL